MSGQQMIKLQSSDGVEIPVGKPSLVVAKPSTFLPLATADFHAAARDVAERSILIKNMMDDIGEQAMTEAIPIPNVSFYTYRNLHITDL